MQTAIQKEFRGYTGAVRLNNHVLFRGTASACERFATELMACGGIRETGIVADEQTRTIEMVYRVSA